jgi:photosystem II stability/assembly factor-like uncharacterized protein
MNLKIILLLFFSGVQFLDAQSIKWIKVDSTNIGRYRAIDCVNDKDCIAIADGAIGSANNVTTDGGMSWFNTLNDSTIFDLNGDSITFPPVKFVSIAYPAKNFCIAVGDSGYYFKSTNIRKTWILGRLPLTQQVGSFQHVAISMIDTLQGAYKTHYEMLLTNDGGLTWFSPQFNLPDSLTPISIMDAKVIAKDYVVVTAYNKNNVRYLLISSDFGKTWSFIIDDLFQNRLEGVYFLNKNIGFAACGKQIAPYSSVYRNIILKTSDGGKTWCVKLDTLLTPATGINKIYFADYDNGFALSKDWGIWRTTNGGDYWFKDSIFDKYYQNVQYFVPDLAVLSPEEIIVITEGNAIFRSILVSSYNDSDEKPSMMLLSPNPACDYIEINLGRWTPSSRWSPSEIQIYNSLGQCVLSPAGGGVCAADGGGYPISFGEGPGVRLDISALPTGAYFLVLRDGKEILTNSFIVLR